jgi:hypothetical protein
LVSGTRKKVKATASREMQPNIRKEAEGGMMSLRLRKEIATPPLVRRLMNVASQRREERQSESEGAKRDRVRVRERREGRTRVRERREREGGSEGAKRDRVRERERKDESEGAERDRVKVREREKGRVREKNEKRKISSCTHQTPWPRRERREGRAANSNTEVRCCGWCNEKKKEEERRGE